MKHLNKNKPSLILQPTVLLVFVATVLFSCKSPVDETRVKLERLNSAIRAGKAVSKEAEQKRTKSGRTWKILVVHSYLNDYRWVQEIEVGLKDRLDGKDYWGKKNPAEAISYDLKIFYMDTKNNTDPAWKKSKGEEALAIVEQWQPDLVITSDDNAQEFFAKKLKDSSLPVVFCGVNKSPMAYGFVDSIERPGHNVTGLVEEVNLYKTLNLAQTLVPGARTAYILGDNSPTNQGVIERLQPLFEDSPLKITGYKLTDSWEEWQEEVRLLQEKADIVIYPHYHTLKDLKGRPVTHDKVLSWTLNNSRVPDFTFWNFGVIDGVLGSISVWGKAHGYEAANIAVRILEEGEKPGDIPIRAPLVGTIILNRERAKDLNIQIPFELLADAVLVNTIGVSCKLGK